MNTITTAQLLLRPLQSDDAGRYRALRLRALAEFPDAFTSSAAEEANSRDDWVAKRLRPREGHVLLGALVDPSRRAF